MKIKKEYCGCIAIMGKTNVGKSTLINQLIGKKISIISRKKHTTQKNITGIKTNKTYQFIYIDTPGLNIYQKNRKIEKYHNSNIIKNNISIILFVLDRNRWTEDDETVMKKIKKIDIPIIIVINKIDRIKQKNILLPFISFLNKKINTAEIIPISAKKNKNIVILNNIIRSYLPKNIHIFPKHQITTESNFFIIAEIIREKLILFLGDELPTTITVQVESITQKKIGELNIKSNIYVKNIQQKHIIIGRNGERIKKCSILSRKEISKLFDMKIHLFLWLKYNTS